MIKLLNYFIGTLVIISIFSCDKTKYKSKIVQIYQIENNKNENPIKIENLKILTVNDIGPEYEDTLKINGYKFMIQTTHKQIELTRENINLLQTNIENYKKLLKLGRKENLTKYELGLNKTKLGLKEENKKLFQFQNDIKRNKREIDYLRTESNLIKPQNLKLIEYFIVASNDSIQLNDTLAVILNEHMKYVFTKNNILSDYKGQ
jgi:hypothetical protein